MSLISLYRVELRRMFLSRWIWVGALCGILTPLLGVIGNETLPSVSSRYIANPVLTATAVSAMLWAVLIILEASRLHRSGVYLLTDGILAARAVRGEDGCRHDGYGCGFDFVCHRLFAIYGGKNGIFV